MNLSSIERALHRAREARARGPHSASANAIARSLHVAMGDPQADVTKVLAILAHNDLLGEDGWLRPEVHLVSMGDHFDWGGPQERQRATESGTLLLAWLSAHPADQVTLLLGNHDLARVGELALFDEEGFRRAQQDADQVYRSERTPADEEAFLAAHPEVPSSEVLARDFSAFSIEQREWVKHLLQVKRFRAAHAHADLLLSHAGVTVDELRGRVQELPSAPGIGEVTGGGAVPVRGGVTFRGGVTGGDGPVEEVGPPGGGSGSGSSSSSGDTATRATLIAFALNSALEGAVNGWDGKPLAIPGLHRPGSAVLGEGVGIFYHRASTLPQDDWSRGVSPPRRRFDPRRLPRGITQVIGHIRDEKSRTLLQEANPREAWDGFLRHLWTDGYEVHYGHGTGERPGKNDAAMIFTDGAMRTCPIAEYELLDLDQRAPLRRANRD